MKRSWAEQLILYQSNVLPVLLEKLSQQLHVSVAALNALEIGYVLHNNCWAFPERDENGDIIGLSLRQWNGKKYMLPESKRGLIYVPNVHRCPVTPGKYQAGPQNWVRTTEDVLCPICGKPDWCLVSSENPDDPKAVLCCRIKEGATKHLGDAGYLHILKTEGELSQAGSVLISSEYPYLIVEGVTDVAAALDIDLVAVGRPSSGGGLDKLSHLIAGCSVVVLGENDSGAGREGMETTFEVLRSNAKHIVKMLPPEGVKDLRQWVAQGLTREQFLNLIRTVGDSECDDMILTSVAPMDLAKQWLETTYYQEDMYTLRVYHGSWYAYTGHFYKEIGKNDIRKQLYQFLGDKQYKKIHAKGFDILNYDPTKHKIDEVMDALLAFCPISAEDIPCWLSKGEQSDPKHILSFPNGYLDISGYAKRDEAFKLQESTPRFFSLACYPYNFDSNASCTLWKKFLNEIFIDDPAKTTLLQEWFGYNLIPDNSQEKFMMLLGPTRAGKGTILDILSYILGDSQVLATSFEDFTRRFAIFPFFGKLAALIGDVKISSGYKAASVLNLLKRITGNDVIMIERKGRDITQTCVRLYTRFTMAANMMPQLPDYARTIESRMLVIQFLMSFAGREDTTLKTRLRKEAPGILLWALEGLKRLQRNGEFTLPATHRQILQRVRGEITPFTDFISEYCYFGVSEDFFVSRDHLFEAWKFWAIKNGERIQTVTWLNRSLLTLYPECKGSRRVIGKFRRRGFIGLRLRQEIAATLGAK